MNRKPQRSAVGLLLAAAIVLTAAGGGQFVFVVLDRATVHAKPAHFSKPVGVVPEGSALKATAISDGWVEIVSPSGNVGYIRETAVRDEMRNRDWGKLVGVPESERDTYAAQKGFGSEVEASYSRREGLDYGPVDQMLSQPRLSLVDLEAFRREGQLGEFKEANDAP